MTISAQNLFLVYVDSHGKMRYRGRISGGVEILENYESIFSTSISVVGNICV